MYVRVTLYKSGFDTANPFVGESKQARETALASLPKLVLPISCYNPRRPFRIAGNFLQYDRIYDYMRYEIGNESDLSDAQSRYYYVSAFVYVNDNETDIAVIDDLAGQLWWDLKFKNLIFDRYTYREQDYAPTQVINNYTVNEYIEDDYNTFSNAQFSVYNGTPTTTFWRAGFVVNVAIINGETYNEGDTLYPLAIDLLPFVYDKISGNVIQKTFKFNNSSIKDIRHLTEYFYQKSDGFKFVDNFVLTANLPKIKFTFEDSSLNNIIVSFDSSGSEGVVIQGAVKNRSGFGNVLNLSLTKGSGLTTSFSLLNSFGLIPYKAMRQSPFCFYRVQANNKYIDINPLEVTGALNVIHSFVPPFNVSVGELTYTTGKYKTFTPYSTFFAYSDAYTEFLRSNYNSVVMGLQVNQAAARASRQTSEEYSYFAAGFKGIASLGGGIARGSVEKAAGGLLSGVAQLGATAISNAEKNELLAINQDKEKELFALRMRDLENTPDQVALNSSLKQIVKSQSYFRIFEMTPLKSDFYIKNFARFGFNLARYMPDTFNTRSHTLYDYVRITGAQFAQDSIKLNQTELLELVRELQGGVRVWYDISHYKDFDTKNEEVTT